MTEIGDDDALGAAIRRRREALGLQQKTLADQLGLAPVVYGRIEVGSRPIRGTELGAVARLLGVTADDLLRDGVPASAEEMIETACTQRDAAQGALAEFAAAFARAAEAVASAPLRLGRRRVGDAFELAAFVTEAVEPAGVRVPAAMVSVVRIAVDDLVASVVVEPAGS